MMKYLLKKDLVWIGNTTHKKYLTLIQKNLKYGVF